MRIIIPKQSIALAAMSLALVTSTTLHAGGITGFSWHSGVASVAATTISPLVAPNNDDAVGASPNTAWVTQKHYVAIGPVDLVLTSPTLAVYRSICSPRASSMGRGSTGVLTISNLALASMLPM